MITIDRIGTQRQSNSLTREINNSAQRLNKSFTQQATGKKARYYHEMARQVTSVESLRSDISLSDQYVRNCHAFNLKLKNMDAVVQEIFDLVVEARENVMHDLSEGYDYPDIYQPTAQVFFDKVASLLNTQIEQEYIFSGSMTDTRPVVYEGEQLNGVFPLGMPESQQPRHWFYTDPNYEYYQGDTDDMVYQLSESLSFAFGLNARDEGFEKALRGLKMFATSQDVILETNATNQGEDLIRNRDQDIRTRMTGAMELMNEAIDRLKVIMADLGTKAQKVELEIDTHDSFKVQSQDRIDEVETVDIAEAVDASMREQIIMQAGFTSMARLIDLSKQFVSLL